MKVAHGGTRFVLLFSSFVIKLPQIPVIEFLCEALKSFKKGQLKKRPIIKRGIFLKGIRANRLEYLYSENHKNSEAILPVYGILFGLILLQKRKEVLTQDDSRWVKICALLKKAGVQNVERIRACNFCMVNQKPRVLDYGDSNTQQILDLYGQKIIDAYTA